MLLAAAKEAHQKDTARVEPADQPSGSTQDAPAAAAAAVTAQLKSPIGPCMPQPAPAALAVSGDGTTYEAGPQLASADSNGHQFATGVPCLVSFQPLVLVMEVDWRELIHITRICVYIFNADSSCVSQQ